MWDFFLSSFVSRVGQHFENLEMVGLLMNPPKIEILPADEDSAEGKTGLLVEFIWLLNLKTLLANWKESKNSLTWLAPMIPLCHTTTDSIHDTRCSSKTFRAKFCMALLVGILSLT